MDLWTYMKGDTDFWHLSSGEHQNLLDEAINYIAKLHQQLDGVRDNAHLKQQPAAANAEIKDEHRMYLVGLLRKQAKEIAQGNIYGWGNTMADAATCICELEAQLAASQAECERLRIQLAACGVAANANTWESAAEMRLNDKSPYWSESYSDVCNAVNREIEHRGAATVLAKERGELRQQLAAANAEIERLQRELADATAERDNLECVI